MITITINTDQEALDALDAKLAERNAALPEGSTPYTRESHLLELVQGEVTRLTEEKYAAALDRLGKTFRPLSYQDRLAIITRLEEQAPS